MTGPLAGTRVIELAGLGPVPFAGMMLSDLGADVIRIDRLARPLNGARQYALARGRRSVAVDLKRPQGRELLLDLATGADAVIEGYRPGVAERLGVGPEECLRRRPQLVYGRVSGWGTGGPLSHTAGHDLNFLALSGALTMFGRGDGRPSTPPGFLADFAGGGLHLALGVVATLDGARRSGQGQVIEVAMVDGLASLSTLIYSMAAQGRWHETPGSDELDGGAPYYDVYETSDGRFVAVAALAQPFYEEFVGILGLDQGNLPDRDDRASWPALRLLFAQVLGAKTRDHWQHTFEETDACVTPVLTFEEATRHPHAVQRGTYLERFGVVQPAPTPRFSRTPSEIAGPPAVPGEHTREILDDWGVDTRRTDGLFADGTLLDSSDGQ